MAWKGVILAGPLLALLVACGPSEQPQPASSQEGVPRPGGTVTYPVAADPWDWDLSYLVKSNPNGDGRALAYSSLLGLKTGPEVKYDQLILQPELAERWEVSPDAKTYTFYLRKGVRFATLPPVDGRELSSADVRWSLEYWSRSGDFKKLPPSPIASPAACPLFIRSRPTSTARISCT